MKLTAKEQKIARLALDKAAQPGERQAAAAKLIESLRARGVTLEDIEGVRIPWLFGPIRAVIGLIILSFVVKYVGMSPHSGVEMAKFIDQLVIGVPVPSPTTYPKPMESSTSVVPSLTEKEIADNIAKEKAAEAKRLEGLDKLRQSLIRESQGSDTIIAATPAPQ